MTEKATFGAGCFWGVEAHFREIEGVLDAAAGYMGGHLERPTYQQVCQSTSGHAEVVEVTFDPQRVPYERLLDAFWGMHDPTQINRQGVDIGPQYRSVIFYHDEAQRAAAEASKASLAASGRFEAPIATHIEPAQIFWRAEEYHQQYLARTGRSCSI